MRDDIEKIYLENKDVYDDFLEDDLDETRRHYVYEWHCNGKHFYVGKGTGKRYRHIVEEADLYERNHRRYKGQRWSILREAYGISHSIIMDELTEKEALIMEMYYIMKWLEERQPLFNHVFPCVDDETDAFWHKVNYESDLVELFKA